MGGEEHLVSFCNVYIDAWFFQVFAQASVWREKQKHKAVPRSAQAEDGFAGFSLCWNDFADKSLRARQRTFRASSNDQVKSEQSRSVLRRTAVSGFLLWLAELCDCVEAEKVMLIQGVRL